MSLESLNQLPDDIILAIFEELGFGWDGDCYIDLINLALCSKRLHRLATPRIYSELRQGTWEQDLNFLLTLLRNPGLGKYSKRLNNFAYDPEERTSYVLKQEDLALCRAQIEKVCQSQIDVDRWIFDLEIQERNALLGLLLSCMPNVISLQIDDYEDSPSNPINHVLQNATQLQAQNSESPLALPRLRSVEFASDGTPVPFTQKPLLNAFLPFLQLPSIQSVDLDHFKYCASITSKLQDFNTKKLTMSPHHMPPEAFYTFISHFKELQHLDLRESCACPDRAGIPPNIVLDALLGLESTLKTLIMHYPAPQEPVRWPPALPVPAGVVLDTHVMWRLQIAAQRGPEGPSSVTIRELTAADPLEEPVFEPKALPTTCLGSLQDFGVLSSLSLDAHMLLCPRTRPKLAELLPAGLRVLVLVQYDEHVVEQVDSLLNDRRPGIPRLRSLELKGLSKVSRVREQWDDLRELIWRLTITCQDQGVDLLVFREVHAPKLLPFPGWPWEAIKSGAAVAPRPIPSQPMTLADISSEKITLPSTWPSTYLETANL